MSEAPFQIAHVDELEAVPVAGQEGLTWRPVRRRFGIGAFGANAYSAVEAGQRVVEEHREQDGHEELYVVLRGSATFTLDDEEVDCPAGTLVFIRPGARRGAIAKEPGTAVLAVGAKRGEIFEPSGWELTFAAFGYLHAGEEEKGRAVFMEASERDPDAWQVFYNFACFEALAGRPEDALRQLRRAVELNPEETRRLAADDSDFDSIREDPRFGSSLAGEPDPGGPGQAA